MRNLVLQCKKGWAIVWVFGITPPWIKTKRACVIPFLWSFGSAPRPKSPPGRSTIKDQKESARGLRIGVGLLCLGFGRTRGTPCCTLWPGISGLAECPGCKKFWIFVVIPVLQGDNFFYLFVLNSFNEKPGLAVQKGVSDRLSLYIYTYTYSIYIYIYIYIHIYIYTDAFSASFSAPFWLWTYHIPTLLGYTTDPYTTICRCIYIYTYTHIYIYIYIYLSIHV